MDKSRGLFGFLDGVPAQAMVVLGLLLTLLAPVIPECASASREAAEADLEAARKLYELEVEQLRKKQEEERAEAGKAASGDAVADLDARRELEKTHAEGLETFKAEARAKHGLDGLEKQLVEARASAAGVKSHLFLNWIGRLLLVLGLLIMTLEATGTRQKVMLVILLVVLFGSITGVNLDVGARAQLGS